MDSSSTTKVIIQDEIENEEENDIDEDMYDQSILSTSQSTPLEKKTISNIKNIQTIRDEKELRLIKLREAIEQQQEIHSKKKEIAETEMKIALLKLLKEEEAFKQIS